MVESPSLCRLRSGGQSRSVRVLSILHTVPPGAEIDFGHNTGANPIGAYLNEDEIPFAHSTVSHWL